MICVIKKNINIIICGILFVGFVWIGFLQFAYLKSFADMHYITNSSGVDFNDAYKYQTHQMELDEKDQYSVLFWTLSDNKTIKGMGVDNKLETEAVIMCGNSSLLVGGNESINFDDKSLCIIGNKVAYDIFGSIDVKGLKIEYDDKLYTIADVTHKNERIFAIQGNDKMGITFNKAILHNVDGSFSIIADQELKSVFGELVLLENNFIIWILELLIAAVLILIVYFAARYTLRYNFTQRKYKFLLVFVATCVSVFIGFMIIDYPADMIPSAWSDFEFWQRLIENKVNSIELYLSEEKTIVGCKYIYAVFGSTVCFIAAIFMCILLGIMIGKNIFDRGRNE